MKNIIKERRKERKLSQKELSVKVNVSRQTIHAIENNKYDPSLSLAFDLAKALETTVEQLFIHEE